MKSETELSSKEEKSVFMNHWKNDSLELPVKNELDPRIRFPASVFSHNISSACGVVVTHQLPNAFFIFFVATTTTASLC